MRLWTRQERWRRAHEQGGAAACLDAILADHLDLDSAARRDLPGARAELRGALRMLLDVGLDAARRAELSAPIASLRARGLEPIETPEMEALARRGGELEEKLETPSMTRKLTPRQVEELTAAFTAIHATTDEIEELRTRLHALEREEDGEDEE